MSKADRSLARAVAGGRCVKQRITHRGYQAHEPGATDGRGYTYMITGGSMKKLLLVIGAILAFSVLGYAETSTGDMGRYQLFSCKQTTAASDGKDTDVFQLFRIDTKTGKTYRNMNGHCNGQYVDTWIAIDEFDQKK